jgi:predicted SAM-dependent methyltransferase
MKLHLGCGPHHLDGWLNVDNTAYPGVDRLLDVTAGLPFEGVSLIFAEHFIEHLDYRAAGALLRECRRVLRDDGVLRLTTPNLDWVWASHYKPVLTADEELLACFAINRAFRGWGHQFLYNFATLRDTLLEAGFGDVSRQEYGQSGHTELQRLESHEQNPDFEGLSHILIVEASGRGGSPRSSFDGSREMYLRDLDVR